MTKERLNELLASLDKELNNANDKLTLLAEEGDPNDPDLMSQIDYWTAEISKITNEMQSLLQML